MERQVVWHYTLGDGVISCMHLLERRVAQYYVPEGKACDVILDL